MNSALLNPSAGMLFNLTLTNPAPPIPRFVGLTSVETNGIDGSCVADGTGVLEGIIVPIGSGVFVGMGMDVPIGSGVFVGMLPMEPN